MTIAVFPGSFDPFTLGHLDVVRRGLDLFDEVVVAVAQNPGKNGQFSAAERIDLVRQTIAWAGFAVYDDGGNHPGLHDDGGDHQGSGSSRVVTASAQRASVATSPAAVRVLLAPGLIVDLCREVGAHALIKGLRGGADFDAEVPMALMNRHLTGVETVFIVADPALNHISSTLVKDVARHGGNVKDLVAPAVAEALGEKLNHR